MVFSIQKNGQACACQKTLFAPLSLQDGPWFKRRSVLIKEPQYDRVIDLRGQLMPAVQMIELSGVLLQGVCFSSPSRR
jgi:hypothetical protein